MNEIFKLEKKNIINDTQELQNLNQKKISKIEELVKFLEPSWYLPLLSLAIENNNTKLIQSILIKSNDSEIINQELKTKRQKNRKQLLKGFLNKIFIKV